MFTPQFGKVKLFRDNFGYIEPSIKRQDGKDYYFQSYTATRFFEEVVGEPDMKFGFPVKIWPIRGDEVVFSGGDYPAGPLAKKWNSTSEWIRVKSIIARRPWVECFHSRIVELNPNTNTKTVVWEGPKALLFELLQEGKTDYLQNPSDWYQKFWCDEFRVEGWTKIPNPLTSELGLKDGKFQITDDQRKLLDNPRYRVNTERKLIPT